MRAACTLILALLTGCLAEQVAAPVATMPAPRTPRIEIDETRLSGSVGYIVDGVAYRWPGDSVRLAELNAEDIESIEIVHGAAVAQHYPAFPCSAIIVITRKYSQRDRSSDHQRQAAPGCMIPSSIPARR